MSAWSVGPLGMMGRQQIRFSSLCWFFTTDVFPWSRRSPGWLFAMPVDKIWFKKETKNNETTDKRTSIHRGEPDTARWETVTCSMSAASLRRWAMSSDSVSRSLRRPDLYSWPTSSLWRLSFTWLTRKCITAFGTLRWRKGERKQGEQMVENKEARWPGDCDCAPDGGARVWPARWLCLSKYQMLKYELWVKYNMFSPIEL